ncbi:NADPH-dependent FMN reductase [Streptomyces profundus]|uniref:NADPH-dependent FMN reductase n=1 Tax=Streptomyces profundus TaxID=2867410 RepID=UPI001D167F72|nr:NAD(P)H-dependent oxidoreductase [Streptomyces sp. MA3_2.13]UED85024.1 NAD(P)H-dependent oxidoreductase [Streptomyces sp. MA3_2.13]
MSTAPTIEGVDDSTVRGGVAAEGPRSASGHAEASAGGAGPVRVAVILGSLREGRFGSTVAGWVAERLLSRGAERGDVAVDVLDVAEVPLGLDMAAPSAESAPGAAGAAGALADVAGRLAAADAFVVITPEYNHSFPAALKNLIDWHFTEWQAKPVSFVSYGGLGGGLRAVEQLRGVFAELHAVTIRRGVSFHHPWNWFDDAGRPAEAESNERAMAGVIDQLVWWATALRSARGATPYEP